MNQLTATITGACLLTLASLAHAQTATKDQPTPVGVSQETANEAQRKAVKDGGAATVIRTGPSAKDKAGEMASDAKDKVKSTTDTVRTKTGNATDDMKKP